MFRALIRNAGIRPAALVRALRGWRRYRGERRHFFRLDGADLIPRGRDLPILTEWDESCAVLGAYFFQDWIAARWIREDAPERHVDVGSRIDGFIGHLAVFRQVEVIDIRPQPLSIPNVLFHQMDLMREVPPGWQGALESLSCLHTIEHFGLGRYGDPIDPAGHLKGLASLQVMVRPGGRLLLSTPVGRERLEFNAHRIFSPNTMLSWFGADWEILRSALVDDDLCVTESLDDTALRSATCDTGVGILCARKRSD